MSNNPWRLYRPEWIVIHTIRESGTAVTVTETANTWIDTHLKGRFPDKHIQLDITEDAPLLHLCRIKIFTDNLKGEFKQASIAEYHAALNGYDEYTIVERNSAEDQKIRAQTVIAK